MKTSGLISMSSLSQSRKIDIFMNQNEIRKFKNFLKILSGTEDKKSMEFERCICDKEVLYGIHALSGVDIIEDIGEGMACLFTLDNETYAALEDPDDGYRSYLGCIGIVNTKPRVTFEPEQVVVCGHNSKTENGIRILNAKTGLEILALYTSDLDDYYPCCRMEYNPENLSANY